MLCGPRLLPTVEVTDAFWEAAAAPGSLAGVSAAVAPPTQDRSAAAAALLKPHCARSPACSLPLSIALTTTVTSTTRLSLPLPLSHTQTHTYTHFGLFRSL